MGSGKGSNLRFFDALVNFPPQKCFDFNTPSLRKENNRVEKNAGKKKMIMEIVATNIVAS